jgi:hypothetical protein
MNKILLIAAIVALVTTLSFAQEGGTKFGIRAGLGLYDLSSGDKEMDRYIDMGYGFGGGLAINIPIASSLSLAPEVSLLYRKLMSAEYLGREECATEFAISIPVILQFMPVEDMPFYLAAGVQLDIPVAPEVTMKESGVEVTRDSEGRTSIDFGIPLGLGYLVNQNLGIDFRAVIGITSPGENDEASWKQYGLGLTYFF